MAAVCRLWGMVWTRSSGSSAMERKRLMRALLSIHCATCLPQVSTMMAVVSVSLQDLLCSVAVLCSLALPHTTLLYLLYYITLCFLASGCLPLPCFYSWRICNHSNAHLLELLKYTHPQLAAPGGVFYRGPGVHVDCAARHRTYHYTHTLPLACWGAEAKFHNHCRLHNPSHLCHGCKQKEADTRIARVWCFGRIWKQRVIIVGWDGKSRAHVAACTTLRPCLAHRWNCTGERA